MKALITDHKFELYADPHNPGSGRYGVRIILPQDISTVFPYLNAVLKDTVYDHENRVLLGTGNNHRCAFRPREIRVATNADKSNVSLIASDVVQLVNDAWGKHDSITPDLRERKLPPAYDIFALLPRTNCKQCGYPTCLAFAAELRKGTVEPVQCPPLLEPEYASNREQISALFTAE